MDQCVLPIADGDGDSEGIVMGDGDGNGDGHGNGNCGGDGDIIHSSDCAREVLKQSGIQRWQDER